MDSFGSGGCITVPGCLAVIAARPASRGVTPSLSDLDISCHFSHPRQPHHKTQALLTPIAVAHRVYINPPLPPAVLFNLYTILVKRNQLKGIDSRPTRQAGSVTPPTSPHPLCRSLTTALVTAYPFREGEEASLEKKVRKGVCDHYREETLLQAYAGASKKYPSVRVEGRARLEQQWEKFEPSKRAGT